MRLRKYLLVLMVGVISLITVQGYSVFAGEKPSDFSEYEAVVAEVREMYPDADFEVTYENMPFSTPEELRDFLLDIRVEQQRIKAEMREAELRGELYHLD